MGGDKKETEGVGEAHSEGVEACTWYNQGLKPGVAVGGARESDRECVG